MSIMVALSKVFIGSDFRDKCKKADEMLAAVDEDKIDVRNAFDECEFGKVIGAAQTSYFSGFQSHIGVIGRDYSKKASAAILRQLDREITECLSEGGKRHILPMIHDSKRQTLIGRHFSWASVHAPYPDNKEAADALIMQETENIAKKLGVNL